MQTVIRAHVNSIRWTAVFLGLCLTLLIGMPAQAFHFPWDQGHDTTDWNDPPPPGPCEGPLCEPCGSTGSPVYIPTGHLIWTEKDVDIFGLPSLTLTRTYNSHDPRNGLFGNGWTVSCDVGLLKVAESGATQYILRTPDGKRYVYEQQQDGSITAPPGRFDSVEPQADGTVDLVGLDGSRQVFDALGRLIGRVDSNGNTLSYSYDAGANLLAQLADDHGRFLDLSYNSAGRVASVTDHTGRTWTYTYDLQGNLVSVTDPLGGIKRYEYTAYQATGDGHTYYHLVKVTDESNVVLTQVTYSGERVASYTNGANRYSYSYNASTQTATKTDSLGSRWTYIFNDDGLITQESDPLGRTVSSQYDADGRLTQYTDELGKIWRATYDGLGRVISETDPLGNTVTWEYPGSYPWPAKMISPLGRETRMDYDSAGNLISFVDPSGAVVTLTRDNNGKLTATRDPLGNQTTITNDMLGRPVTTTDPLGRVTQKTYDSLSNLISETNARGETTSYAYDALKRLVSLTDPLGQSTDYTYDAAGRLETVTDPAGNITRYSYDSFGRLAERIAPDGRTTRYQYKADNQLDQVTHPNGLVVTYQYDGLKRVTSKDVGTDVYTYTYDARGQLTQATNSAGTVSRSYDDAGQLIQETINGQTVAIALNEEGERTQLSALGSTTTYTRDIRGLVSSISTANGQYQFSYNANGTRTRLTLPNTAQVDYTYDAANQLTSLIHSGVLEASFNYSHDPAGNLTNQTGSDQNAQYQYDAEDKLIQANVDNQTFAYLHDAVGNILNNGRQYDASNRLIEDNQYLYSYDLNGNLTEKSDKTTGARTVYEWDAQNQLLKVERYADGSSMTPNKVITFTYGPLGRRLSKTEDGQAEKYLYDRFDRIATLDGSDTVLNVITFGPGTDEPLGMSGAQGERYFHADQLGSVIALTDNSGVTSRYSYSPYGETQITGEPISPFGFTGRELDAADLYFYRTRYYDPTLQRFLSEDPIGLKGGLNLYSYVEGNPVNNTDPLGLQVGSPEYCRRLLERIRNVERKIQERIGELKEDPLNLPEACPGDDVKPSLSRRGHRKLINMDKANLVRLKALYAAYCSNTPPPPPVPVPETSPETNPETNPSTGVNWEAVGIGVGIVVGVVAIGALIYFTGGGALILAPAL